MTMTSRVSGPALDAEHYVTKACPECGSVRDPEVLDADVQDFFADMEDALEYADM